MKRTIAKKLTTKLAVLTVAVIVVLLACAYFVVFRIVLNETKHYTCSIASIYADSVKYEFEGTHFPIDSEHNQFIIDYGDYICQWYRVDYSYAYKVYPGENKTVLLGFNKKKELPIEDLKETGAVSKEFEYILSEKEESLWNGEIDRMTRRNDYFENALESMEAVTDDYGNRVIFVIGMSIDNLNRTTISEFIPVLIMILVAFAGMISVTYFIIRKSIFNPAKRISESMTAFITNGKRQEIKLDEDGDDEFAMISKAFNSMTVDIDEYLTDIKNLSGAKERNAAELNIASAIQQGLLSAREYSTDDYIIRAMMRPAKDVGGDLYDYLPLSNGKIMITVADVSGKGIAASMYMAVALVLMRQFARMVYSPAEILQSTNDIITERNSGGMFITAFVAIYDPGTKKLVYSNAGHNPPYVIGIKPKNLNGKLNPILGVFESEEYEQAEIQLENGDVVFLYTDGINEARNSSNQFYGDERLRNALTEFRKSHSDNIVSRICDSIDEFVADAEQYDDMTMLALTVRDYTEFEVDIDVSEFKKISDVILSSSLERSIQLNLCVIAEEIFVNICSYAFPEGVPEGEKVKFRFEHSDRIIMRFEDGGMEFNPTENVIDPDEYDPDTQIGGLGRLIAFTSADEVKYERLNGRNVIQFDKYIKEE